MFWLQRFFFIMFVYFGMLFTHTGPQYQAVIFLPQDVTIVLRIAATQLKECLSCYLEDNDCVALRHLSSLISDTDFVVALLFEPCSDLCDEKHWFSGAGCDENIDGHGFEYSVVQMREDLGVSGCLLPPGVASDNVNIRRYLVTTLLIYFQAMQQRLGVLSVA